MSPTEYAVVIAVAAVVALVVHEAGHAVAALALGGEQLRLVPGWPALRVEATLPDGPGVEFAFVVAGVLANVGAAGGLLMVPAPEPWPGVLLVAAVVQLVCVVVNLLPAGRSDGARLLALWRGDGRGA